MSPSDIVALAIYAIYKQSIRHAVASKTCFKLALGASAPPSTRAAPTP